MRISEVSKLTGFAPDTLRFYERVGVIREVERPIGNQRSYQDEDCKWLLVLKQMHDAGMSIVQMKQAADFYQQGSDGQPKMRQLLLAHQSQLAEKLQIVKNLMSQIT